MFSCTCIFASIDVVYKQYNKIQCLLCVVAVHASCVVGGLRGLGELGALGVVEVHGCRCWWDDDADQV